MQVVSVRKKNIQKLGYSDFREWIKDPNNVYIGRKVQYIDGTYNSIFRNPYSAKKYGRNQCIELYKKYITNDVELMEKIKTILKGKTLGCWCKPLVCHGDVIIELFNK
jgi:hypothetical protein